MSPILQELLNKNFVWLVQVPVNINSSKNFGKCSILSRKLKFLFFPLDDRKDVGKGNTKKSFWQM